MKKRLICSGRSSTNVHAITLTHRVLDAHSPQQYRSPANQLCWCTQTGFKTLTRTHSTHSTQLFVSWDHTNCQHPAWVYKKPAFQELRLGFCLCARHIQALPQGSDGRQILNCNLALADRNRRRAGGIRFLQDADGKWHRVEKAMQTQIDRHKQRWTNTTDSIPPSTPPDPQPSFPFLCFAPISRGAAAALWHPLN